MRKPIQFTCQLLFISIIAVAFSGCFPATKAVIKASKGPKEYALKSIDSAFLTDQNFAIIYTTVTIKGKNKVQMASFRVQKTGEGNTPEGYTPFATMNNDTYKIAAPGNIVKRFKVTANSADVFDGSGEPALLVQGNLPNKRILLSVYAYPDLPDWGRYSIALQPHTKTRRPYMYALTPVSVAADATIMGVGLAVGIVAVIALGIRSLFI